MSSNDFKILKKQMKSENYEICQYLVISYVEAVVKNWVGFVIFLRTMLTNENISEEKSESWEGCGYVWSESDSRIWVRLGEFFYSSHTTCGSPC